MKEIFQRLPEDGASFRCSHISHELEREKAVKMLTVEAWDMLRKFGFHMRTVCVEHAVEAENLLKTRVKR